MKRDVPAGLLAWCALVLVASFLPWGTYTAVPHFNVNGISFPDGMPFPFPMTVTGTGWQGQITAFSIEFPNWLVVISALVIALHALLRLTGIVADRRGLGMVLGFYGILHITLVMAVVLANNGTIGIGSILTFIAFAGILLALVRRPSRKPEPA